MNNITKRRSIASAATAALTTVAAAALALSAATATPAVASAPRELATGHIVVRPALSALSGVSVETATSRPVHYVTVTNALLRARPTRNSTALDASGPGRGVTIYCWHDYTDSSHLVWFRVNPWGSRYIG